MRGKSRGLSSQGSEVALKMTILVGFVVGLFWIPTNRDAGTDIMLLAGYPALPFSTCCNAEEAAVASGHTPDATPENEAMITRHGGDSNRLIK